MEKQITDDERNNIKELADGKSINQLVHNLLDAYDPDKNVDMKMDNAQLTMTDDEKKNYQLSIFNSQLVKKACLPFSKPDLRNYLESCRQSHEQILDNQNIDNVIFAGFDEQAK